MSARRSTKLRCKSRSRSSSRSSSKRSKFPLNHPTRMMREQRSAIMDQLLTAEAKQRLSNIAVVKPEKAERLEAIIIQNAQRGMI